MTKEITFGDIREYCSRIDRISICMKETLAYQNYRCMNQIPHELDHFYVYGFGMVQSEFDDDGSLTFEHCIEFMLTEEPRDDL